MNDIPEINDTGVNPKFRRHGIDSILMDEAGKNVSEKPEIVGISFGISADYGPAQRMFVKRGYIPDGEGLRCAEQGFIGGSL